MWFISYLFFQIIVVEKIDCERNRKKFSLWFLKFRKFSLCFLFICFLCFIEMNNIFVLLFLYEYKVKVKV